MQSEHTATLAMLKRKFPNSESMYDHLEDKGWYLPPFYKHGKRLRIWSQRYLLALLEGKAYKIKRTDIRIPK